MLYRLVRFLITPILYILMFFNTKKGEFLKARFKQNLDILENKDYIWIHASSVGEINLSETFIKKLLEKRSERILITMFTNTGYEVAQGKFKGNERVNILYFPLDDRKIIQNILNRINLKFLILVETEIWPNLIELSHEFGKVIMINGRISDRSYKRYEKIKFLLNGVFKNVDRFYMQTKEDSKRIISLGADSEKTQTLGNLKFDIKFQEYSDSERKEFKKFLNIEGRKVFTAGSIRTGEYELILDVFKNLKDTVLILVPRHIERTPKICELLKENNFKFIKYSEIIEKNYKNCEKFDIMIVDAIGILRKIYSITDIAFVGGTLVNIGGHSLLEPLFYGKTPIFGGYLQNVKEISKEILQYKIGYKAENKEEFLKAIESIEKKQDKSKSLIDDLFEKNKDVAINIINNIEKLELED